MQCLAQHPLEADLVEQQCLKVLIEERMRLLHRVCSDLATQLLPDKEQAIILVGRFDCNICTAAPATSPRAYQHVEMMKHGDVKQMT